MLTILNRPLNHNRVGARLDSVQIMRAVAALAVCVAHILHEVSLYAPSPTIQTLQDVPWGIGVDLFFVISGFIMTYMSTGSFGQPHAALVFIKRRLIRIVPPYWFFTSCMIAATLLFPTQLHAAVFGIEHAILSYLFIPHFNPGQAGVLQPILGLGWTLVYEMFFYVAFAICLLMKEKKALFALTVFFLALFATAKMGVWNEALNVFWSYSVMFNFLLGVFIAKFFEYKRLTLRHILALDLALVGIMAIAYACGVFASERIFCSGIPALIAFSLLFYLPIGTGLAGRGLVLLGDASYTLYLIHPFVLVVVKQVFTRLHLLGDSFVSIAFYCIVTLLAAIVSALAFYLTLEKPMTKLLLARLLPRREGKGFGLKAPN